MWVVSPDLIAEEQADDSEHAPAGLHGRAAPYDQAGQHGQAAGRRPSGWWTLATWAAG